MSGRTEAQRLVENICKEHGHISQEILDRLSEADRAVVVQAMLSKDKLIASSVTTLARNLYTSNARFVFELLQNCDDNRYTRARAGNEKPCVLFSVYSDRIIMECNEDGFNPENLIAICNVGKSSKSGAQGYIGEKGIGFKSVFMAAYKAHIQSGDFSFSFQHRTGDPGMGMITPVWQDPEDDLGNGLTRITLFLHDVGDPDVLEQRRQTIRQQFREIHDTILLFMKNMERIAVIFYGDDEEEELTITYSIDRQTDTRLVVNKSTYEDGNDHECVRHYHTTRHIATNLAENENRNYSDLERHSKAYSRSEVVLAFPLDGNSPQLENQWIFAFLPVRQMGFKFLIQADFVTQANRQDIVTTSARNQGLANGIAEAFIKAVLQFCEHDTLRYQWMRYLPREDEYPWDTFWISLIHKIGDRLQSTPVLQPASPGPLKRLGSSRINPGYTLDKYNRPLFPDIAPRLYLSLRYRRQDLILLMKHGLNSMSMSEILERVKQDLAASYSKMKLEDDEDWHSRAAQLLAFPFRLSAGRRKEVKQLSLLPLRDGCWTSIKSGTVYYPRVICLDLNIPLGLALDVLDSKAVANDDRKKLFDSVGVQTATPSFIREAIFKKHNLPFSLTYRTIASHIRFLYLTQHFAVTPDHYDRVYLTSAEGLLWRYDRADIYIRDDGPYGASELLKRINSGPNTGDGAPGFEVSFVHDIYFKHTPNPPTRDSLPWKDWLHTFCHVHRSPRLIDRAGTKLSNICKYVAEYRPEKFLGFLRATWEVEPPSALQEDIIKELGKLEVLCVGGDMSPLRLTYLPVKELEQLCGRFLLDDEFFPWLQLETDLNCDTFPPEWQTLGEIFGLGFNQSDIVFILDILKYLLDQNISAEDLIRPERVYEIYIYLQAEVRMSNQLDECENVIREYFVSKGSIFVPESTTQQATWALPEDCVWESPIEMVTKHSLAKIYANQFQRFNADRSSLANFFGTTLKIPNCNWEHLVEEIRAFKSSGCTDFDNISALYSCLMDECRIGSSAHGLKDIFKSEALICGFNNQATSWHKTTQCLWTSATQIRGMLTLNELYPDLRDFFIRNLGVRKMTVKMVYDKLIGPRLSVDEAKQTIETFNSLLLVSKDVELDPTPLLQKEVFPIKFRDRDVRLLSMSDSFALLDRKSLGDDFLNKAKFLDFGIEETRNLQTFIKWSGLEDRYLSKSVREISSASEDSTRPISSPDREIKRKARALLSIAVAYNSPRTQGDREAFYTLLRRSKTLETDSITSELHLHQGGQILKVEKTTAMLHIHEDPTSLEIYLPRNERSQEFCFNSKLPRLFCEWMMTESATQIREPVSPEAVGAIQSVLSVKPLALVDVLDDHGISLVDVAEEEAEELEEDYAGSEPPKSRTSGQLNVELLQHDTSDSQRSNLSDHADLGTDTPPASVGSLNADRAFMNEEVSSFNAMSGNTASGRGPPHINVSVPSSNEYSALLRQVVDCARRATFPSLGAFNMSAIRGALGGMTSKEEDAADFYHLHFTSKLEQDKQIGAAGELFVFELLSHLNPSLSGFSLGNWQSTIRNYVSSHPEYSNISPWNGREQADIMYMDNNSTLTDLLIDKGYLPSNFRVGERLQYYIEVKTTTGACETPFYMSKYQYKRMQDLSINNAETRQRSCMYVIFRVFYIGNDSIGLKVLVDPENMRQRSQLAFTGETWSVISSGE